MLTELLFHCLSPMNLDTVILKDMDMGVFSDMAV